MNENETLAYLGDAELDSRSSDIGSLVADAGYDVTPRVLINGWNCWSISVGLFKRMLQDSRITNSIGINKWSGGQRIFKVGESGDGDSRMVAWVRAAIPQGPKKDAVYGRSARRIVRVAGWEN